MSINSFGHLFRVTTWGESHGPAIGATVDGCPPGVAIDEAMIQHWLDRRKPGQNKFTTQRREADEVRILSGTFEGKTTGTPVQLMIENTDQRSRTTAISRTSSAPVTPTSPTTRNTVSVTIVVADVLRLVKRRRASPPVALPAKRSNPSLRTSK